MTLEYNHYMEALQHVLTNLLELIIESPIWKNLTHTGYEYIEHFANIADTDIQNLSYKNPPRN